MPRVSSILRTGAGFLFSFALHLLIAITVGKNLFRRHVNLPLFALRKIVSLPQENVWLRTFTGCQKAGMRKVV